LEGILIQRHESTDGNADSPLRAGHCFQRNLYRDKFFDDQGKIIPARDWFTGEVIASHGNSAMHFFNDDFGNEMLQNGQFLNMTLLMLILDVICAHFDQRSSSFPPGCGESETTVSMLIATTAGEE
jgi:hypothetical protein